MITIYALYGFTRSPNSLILKHRGGGMQCDSLPGDGFPIYEFCTTDTTMPQINIKGLPVLSPKQLKVK